VHFLPDRSTSRRISIDIRGIDRDVSSLSPITPILPPTLETDFTSGLYPGRETTGPRTHKKSIRKQNRTDWANSIKSPKGRPRTGESS
jgi:hypothetical protein